MSSVQINGPALRTIRKLRGRSCRSIAHALGVDVSFLCRVERGEKRGVNPDTFRGLVRELGLIDGRAIVVNPYERTVTGDTPPSSPLGLTLGTALSTVTSSSNRKAA